MRLILVSARFLGSLLTQLRKILCHFTLGGICCDWTTKQFFRIDKQHRRKGAVHERSWEGTNERRRSWNRQTPRRSWSAACDALTGLFTSRDLQESKARLEEAQRVAHVGYWVWNLDADRVTSSDETYRIFGLKPQEVPIDLATVREMIYPEDRESVFRTAEEAVLGGVRPDSEHRLVRPSGEVRTVHSHGEVKRDASGRPYQMFGTVQDITDRKRAEEALQRTQLYLKVMRSLCVENLLASLRIETEPHLHLAAQSAS